MKTRILLLAAALLILLAGAAGASEFTPGAGLHDSPHDFSASGGGVGLCTFCHTPHRAIESRLLWNHKLSGVTYSWQDVTQTIGGTTLPTISTDWSGPSKFCLSCHDGSVAIGDINWWKAGTPATPVDPSMHAWPDKHNVGATGGTVGNLSGNHPVAVPYPFGQVANTYNGVTTGSSVIMSEFAADPAGGNIRLFNNPSGSLVVAGAVAGKTGIECSSCHDPHNGPTVEDDFLVRGKLTGATLAEGYLCLKCHSK